MGTSTPTAWLGSLPEGARRELARVRAVILENLPADYRETVTSGTIVYEVPLEVYPDTYNGQALWYAALGAGKAKLSLHLLPVYGDPALAARLREGFAAAGKKLDMGKACVRFRKADDLALDVIGAIVAATPVERFVAAAKAARPEARKRTTSR